MHTQLRRVATMAGVWVIATMTVVGTVGLASVVISGWLIDGMERANGGSSAAMERSGLGDYFGGVSARSYAAARTRTCAACMSS